MTARFRGNDLTAPAGSPPRPLRVLVNATRLRLGGGGTYLVQQLAALSDVQDLRITTVTTADMAERLRARCGPSVRVIARPNRALPIQLLYEQLVLPFRARHHDVVYQLGGFALFASPRPQIVLNHNAHHFGAAGRRFARERYPRLLRCNVAIQRRVARASVRRAAAFVVVSRSLHADVEQDLGPRDSVHILPTPPTPLPVASGRVDSLGLDGRPYVLAVAHDYIHKDWDGLIRAFEENPDLPQLVIAGAPRSEERQSALERLTRGVDKRARVTLLGPVSDPAIISALCRGASCMVAHSFLESGPLTVSEAVGSGVRLVASDIPPHREFAGADAWYYDPIDSNALAAAVRSAIAAPPPPQQRSPIPEWTWSAQATELARILRMVART